MNRSLLVVLSLLCVMQLWGQGVKIAELQYISPKPGSKFIMPGNNIALRYSEKFDPNSVKQSILNVKSTRNGEISGNIKLSDDGKTLLFKPKSLFPLGDIIHVTLNKGLRTLSGIDIESVQFQFEVSKTIIQTSEKYFIDKHQNQNLLPVLNTPIPTSTKIEKKENNLPEGFPGIQVNVLAENASKGYYFFTPYDEWGWYPDTEPYITITDLYGTPVYYRKMQNVGYDLKIQPPGFLSFYSYHPFWKHMVMDSSYQIIDSYQMGNGYGYTDFHEFQLLENGHAFVMTYDSQYYPMDTVVPGGHPNAIVTGFVFQELDTNKEVVFQWRSWDHFLVTDAGPFVDLTDSIIDYVHGNTIDIESESSLLISCRNMDEITRINRNTGEIIWRFGGKNNQFEFMNDTLGFSVQHDSRRLENGNITLFDNGSLHPDPKYSSGLEYEMDEVNMTATLIHRLRNTPDILGVVMGNKQWRSENSKVIGWGSGVPGISEFDANDNMVYEMEFEGISYRSYLFPWVTNYFLLETDTLQYGYIWQENTLTKTLNVYNNSSNEINLTSYYSMNSAFTVENEFPITIAQGESKNLQVKFNPEEVGFFEGKITINSDINSDTLVQRIAQQVYLVGNATTGQSVNQQTDKDMLIYPNPVANELIIEFSKNHFMGKIQLHNIFGSVMIEQIIDKDQKITLDISQFSNGVYFVHLIDKYNKALKFYKIVKK